MNDELHLEIGEEGGDKGEKTEREREGKTEKKTALSAKFPGHRYSVSRAAPPCSLLPIKLTAWCPTSHGLASSFLCFSR